MTIKQESGSIYFAMMFFMLIGLSSTAIAASNLLPPQKVIDNTSSKLKAKLNDPNFAGNQQKLNQYIDKEIFKQIDFYRMSALVLGKHWKTASKEQKQSFTREFKTLLVRTYSAAFTKQFKEWTIHYLPLKMKDGAKKATVKTQIIQPSQQPVSVDYYMAIRKGQWKVYDLKIEGISLVITNRNTFNSMVKKTGSLDAVIAELSKKNKKQLELNS
jgi:phospholipid transport system substrate-binding protein